MSDNQDIGPEFVWLTLKDVDGCPAGDIYMNANTKAELDEIKAELDELGLEQAEVLKGTPEEFVRTGQFVFWGS